MREAKSVPVRENNQQQKSIYRETKYHRVSRKRYVALMARLIASEILRNRLMASETHLFRAAA